MSKPLPSASGHFRRSYADEFRLIETPFAKAMTAVFLLLLVGFPFVASPFFVDLATQVFLASIGALALMLLTGIAGQISLGHAGLIAAGAFTAIGIAAATLLLTPFLAILPKATLSATIVIAVLTLVDFSILKRAWSYSKADFAAVAFTLAGTLLLGVEVGISLGVGASILIFLYRSSQPHAAIVGQVPGTEHYRNIKRHQVDTVPGVLSIRVDESLYFANARYLEDLVINQATANPGLTDVVLMSSAVNTIDMSALESLEAIEHRLVDLGVRLHLSEVKGPVMDKLRHTDFLTHLSGDVHLSQHQAICAIQNARAPSSPPDSTALRAAQ